VSSGSACSVVFQPTFGFTVKDSWKAELLATAGRSRGPAHLVAADTSPHHRQLFFLEADWCVDASAGHLTVYPQEVVAVASFVPQDVIARMATQHSAFAVHCSIQARYFRSYLFSLSISLTAQSIKIVNHFYL